MNDFFQFHREFDCPVDELLKYRVRFMELDRPKGWRSSSREMLVQQSLDGGARWNAIPLRLDCWSRILLWTAASPFWPPEVPVELGYANGELWFEYVDAPDEEPPWLGRPALWRATYRPAAECWRIRRLKGLG